MVAGFVGLTRTLSRKRIAVSKNPEISLFDSDSVVPLKRMCSEDLNVNFTGSRLEELPQEILIKVLCGVDHEDLNQLFHVSKVIRDAAVIAKQWHFEYSTPKKKAFVFVTPIDAEYGNDLDEIEAPNAPVRKSKSRLLNVKKLADISVALFTSAYNED